MITKGFRRVAAVTAATLAFSFTTVGSALAQTLNGAGASFPRPLYSRYFSEYKKATGVQVNYNSIGSGGGIKQFIADTVDFGASDAPPESNEKTQMKKGLLLVPTAGGAVAVAYNVPGVSNLKLSRTTLPLIFSGDIKTWNDSRIKADNPGANLPNMPIKVAVRADGSGTTFIFTSHLAQISSSFRSKVGADKAPNWPGGFLKGPKNDGVASLIKQTRGSIGYVQADYAEQNNMATAAIQNKAGQFVAPTLANANTALEGVDFNSDFTTRNSTDPSKGYPIVGVTWLMLKTNYGDASKAAEIKKLVNWILTDGQNINGQLEYTRIPSSVASKVRQAVNSQVK
jgi:phosphate transport system substrate-binding protein